MGAKDKMGNNKTMMQYFEWYYPDNCTLWHKVKKDAQIQTHEVSENSDERMYQRAAVRTE